MGTNKIKPFATSGSANVMTDEELGSANELSTGFKLRSKADSRLIGKLIQNASAAAYAVGKFTADNSDGTITGTDAEGFATNFETAIKKVVTENVGEAGDYVTSEQLAKYAPLAGATFTGPVTVQPPSENGHPATKQYVDEAIPDISNLATKAELSQKANTVHTHTIENVTGLQDALDGKQATGDYAVKSDLDDYLPLAGGTITGDLTVTGTINATIEGTTENATKLATARAFTVTGAVTGAGTTSFDGTADLAINTTAVNGTMVTGAVPEATKATQDGDGNVISTTYAKINQLSSVMTYKGTVASESALPKSDQTVGDVYNITDTNMNYAWDGSKWDPLGSSVDLSGYLTTENANRTFATKTELTGGYLPLAGGTVTGNITAPTFVGKLQGNADTATTANSATTATSATKASTADTLTTARTIATTGDVVGTATGFDGSENISITTTLASSGVTAGSYGPSANATPNAGATFQVPQVTVDAKGRVTSAVTRTVKIPSAPTTVSGNAGTATKLATARTIAIGGVVTGTATSFDGSANITINATAATDSSKVPLSGARGTLAGYESVTRNVSTITNTTGDAIETNASKVTVNNGTSGQCWTKVARLTARAPVVTLGSNWKWQGGSVPELKQNGFLVLCWCGSGGLAIYNNVG